jgi:hypothetical protein
MIQAKPQVASFEEYLALDPGDLPEGFYEYVDRPLSPQKTSEFCSERQGKPVNPA